MDYYLSASDLIMANGSPSFPGSPGSNEANPGSHASPSAVFEAGYVPFSSTPRAPSVYSDSEIPIPSVESDDDPESTTPERSASSDMVPAAPPNSPVASSSSVGQPLANFALPIQNRRPGRPRGGRLSDAEQYYRAVAASLHAAQPRGMSALAAFNVLQGADQTPGQGNTGLAAPAGFQRPQGGAGTSGGPLASPTGQSLFSATATLNGADFRSFPGFISPGSNNTSSYRPVSNASTLASGSRASDQDSNPGTSNTVSTPDDLLLALRPQPQVTAPTRSGPFTRQSTAQHLANSSHIEGQSGASGQASVTQSAQTAGKGAFAPQRIPTPFHFGDEEDQSDTSNDVTSSDSSVEIITGDNFTHPNVAGQSNTDNNFTRAQAQNTPRSAMAARYDPVHPSDQFTQQSSQFTPSALQEIQSSFLQSDQSPVQVSDQNPIVTQSSTQNQSQNQTQHQTQNEVQYQTGLFSQFPSFASGPFRNPFTLLHDLPPSVFQRPRFQKVLKMATDPKQLPENCTPEEAGILQAASIHVASAKFNKVREANNKSAKRGRYKRMAATVSLADEVMRQKFELKKLREEKNELAEKIGRVESVMPGITNIEEVNHGLPSIDPPQNNPPQLVPLYRQACDAGLSSSFFNDGNQSDASSSFFNAGNQTGATSSFFNDGNQQYDSGTQHFNDGAQQYNTASDLFIPSDYNYSSHDNPLGIMQPNMSDLFGSPFNSDQSFQPFDANNNYINPTSDACTNSLIFPPAAGGSGPSNLPNSSPQPDESASNTGAGAYIPIPDNVNLSLHSSFMREAQEMRLQLIDAVRAGKMHALGFGCHEEIDAVVQRGRKIREMLGLSDPDWDGWKPSAQPSGSGRRKRTNAEVDVDDDDDGEDEYVGKGKGVARKRGRKSQE
ncbi:hypothetical protein GE09DRAFT_1227363 [Coniochaeta sp. 2T2.1]|nr:hypothetical protein GE09DRAFT_1227363 [Coniochaeta sp. 2T2.1]